jgi:hypothetical protein
MTFMQRQYRKRISLGFAFAILLVYYLLVFRPLVQKERAQIEPFEIVQAELLKIATNNAAVSGLSLSSLEQLEKTLRASIATSATARSYVIDRFASEPSIATNLTRTFQLIDYQNERYKRATSLEAMAQKKGVKIAPAVMAGLPEQTTDTRRRELLWAQLGLVDAVLRTAVEVGVTSLDNVRVPEPVIYPPANDSDIQLVEVPVRVEMSGDWFEITRTLGVLLHDAAARKELNLPVLEGLPGMSLRSIIARKSPPESPGTIQLDVEFSGFLNVRVAGPAASSNPVN